MSARASIIMAFDFGLKHIGVATGQPVTATATPAAHVPANDGVPDWSAIKALVAEWRPDALVVGLPLNMDGTESEMSGRARAFANQLETRFALPTHLVDERLTSFEARARTNTHDNQHAVAAQLIAETYLASQANRS